MNPQQKKAYDDATEAAQVAAETIGGTYTPSAGFAPTPQATAPSPITREKMAPASLQTFVQPETPMVPNLSAIDTAIVETAKPGEETAKTQSLYERLMASNEALTGKGAYMAEQEAAIAPIAKTVSDLTSQYNAIINEQQAIPLQIQQEAAGKGLTAAGIAPLQTAALRNNAIKALNINSLLQSAQGNLAMARATADRAIQLKFADEEAKNAALIKNIALIEKSPAYTAEEKARAAKQSLLLQDRQSLIAQKKEDTSSIQALAAAAVKNNPGDQGALMTAQQVLANPNITLSEAFAKLGQYQSDPMAIKDAILEQEYKRAQISALNTKATTGGAVGGVISAGEQLYSGLSSPTATAVRSKVSKFSSDPVVTNFSTIQEGYNFAKTISDKTNNPSDDQALIYAFAKVMDPGSVVREGEYATVQKYSQSWVNSFGKGVSQAINGTGFLSDTARANIKKTLKARYEASKSNYDNTVKNYSNSINNLTGRKDGDAFLTDYTNENIQEQEFDINAWIKAPPSYSQDLKMAKEAIAQGEDREKVKAMMLKKYKTVEL